MKGLKFPGSDGILLIFLHRGIGSGERYILFSFVSWAMEDGPFYANLAWVFLALIPKSATADKICYFGPSVFLMPYKVLPIVNRLHPIL